MATEQVTLTVIDDRDRHGNGTSPYVKCPIHGTKIYTHTGVVNKISCDICDRALGYGGCCASGNSNVCEICGRLTCKSCSSVHSTGGHTGAIVCKKCFNK